MKRPLIYGTLVCLLAFGLFSAVHFNNAGAAEAEDEDTGYPQIAVFARAVQLIRQDYVDGNKITYQGLIYAALKGMLSSLDPHSQFLDPNDFKDMQDDTRSRFNGLGIEVSVRNGVLTVITPMEGTPAAKAGIVSGDQILKINGISTERMELQDAVNILRGHPGQPAVLTVFHPTTKEMKEYKLDRMEIKIESVKGKRLLDQELSGQFKIGYVRLVQFTARRHSA